MAHCTQKSVVHHRKQQVRCREFTQVSVSTTWYYQQYSAFVNSRSSLSYYCRLPFSVVFSCCLFVLLSLRIGPAWRFSASRLSAKPVLYW